MYVCFINVFTKLKIDTLLQKNTMLKNRLSKISIMTDLEISCGYAMNFKSSKARERFKDKGMIYFRNKDKGRRVFEDWQPRNHERPNSI